MPHKANTGEGLQSLGSETTRPSLHEFLVFSSLSIDPLTKLWIGIEVDWNETVTELGFVFGPLEETLAPDSFVTVPAEPDGIESANAILRQV